MMRNAEFYLFLIYCNFIQGKQNSSSVERWVEGLIRVANGSIQFWSGISYKKNWIRCYGACDS
jgi:hypothetical protein